MEYNYLLIVEDEEKISSLIKDYAKPFFKKINIIADGKEFWNCFNCEEHPNLIVLDIMLPGKNGLEICAEIRKQALYTPVIMLTAKTEEIDKLIGFDTGVDDYICKPFSPRELIARMHALLKRTSTSNNDSVKILTYAGIEMNVSAHTVTVDNDLIKLTPNEFGILKILINHPNHVFSRLDLLEKVLGYDYAGYDRTIDTHIKNLRKKILAAGKGKDLIKTIYGIGYKISDID